MSAPVVPPPALPRQTTDLLASCVEAFRHHLYLPDPGSIHIALATVVANRGTGDPVWTLLVGASSSGKTEPLRTLGGQPDCYLAGTLTEAGLLSGVPKKNHGAGAKGGLLRDIGDFGILLVKDFTSVLSMQRDSRASLLAALREIADGSWTRIVGSDGGRTLTWTGKLGLLGGVTGAIDSAHGVMSLMGERFVLYRMPDMSAAEQGRVALGRRGSSAAMRAELAEGMSAVLAAVPTTPAPALADADVEWLVALAELAVRARSAVERDGYTREVTLIPEAEAPARLALALRQLLHGLECIGLPPEEARVTIRKTALDCIPVFRRKVLEHLTNTFTLMGTGTAAEDLGYPTITTRRTLEDLQAHGLVRRERTGGSRGDEWELTANARALWLGASVSETSGGHCTEGENERPNHSSIHTLHVKKDKSDTQSDEEAESDMRLEVKEGA